MVSHPRIAELLVETGAYKDLERPVILTSGLLGIYYINTEKLAQDSGEFAKYGDDSKAMINHAYRMMQEHLSFAEVIEIISDEVENGFAERGVSPNLRVISGGQRRDWLFSGPVARALDYPHVSLYNDGHLYMIRPDGETTDVIPGFYASHVSDLLTKGSSSLDLRKIPQTGWLPMLWDAGIRVSDFSAVVTRLQGGEKVLAKAGIDARSFVQIDEAFLREHSKQSDVAIDYVTKGALLWGTEHLETHVMEAVIDAFDPSKKKDDRAAKFLAVYDQTLRSTNMRDVLRFRVLRKYDFDIDTLPSSFSQQEE